MVEKFVFNEKLKRLEPTENNCFFCRKEKKEQVNDSLFIAMYKPIKKLNLVVYRSVNFSKLPVGVPRCKSCLQIHTAALKKANMYSCIIAIAICLVLCLFGPAGIVLGLVSIGFTYYILNDYLPGKYIQKMDIFTIKDAGKLYEPILELINAGWSLEQPRA